MRTAKTLSLALLVIAMSVRGWAEEVNPTAIFDKVSIV